MNTGQGRSAGLPLAGNDLRDRVELLGRNLGEALSRLVGQLPRKIVGPQSLSETLGITVVTASRFLKALAQTDSIATLQLVPGPNPLRQIVEAARGSGVDGAVCDRAHLIVEEFDQLIRTEARDRSGFNAIINAWLPGERRDFEAQRRQSIYKGMRELDGVSSDLELDCIVLHPAAQGSGVDLVSIKCMLGVDRIRPDAVVKLGTVRLDRDGESAQRAPTTLDGEPALDGLHTVRLDEFCSASPAPLAAQRFGSLVQYSLGPTGFGPGSTVDLVIAEVNRGELRDREPGPDRPPHFWTIPEMASRRLVLDLVVHRDVYTDYDPELLAYNTAGQGAAPAFAPEHELDRRHVCEPLEHLGQGISCLRLLEFGRYTELMEKVMNTLGWAGDEFRSYRVSVPYPLVGTQICQAFRTPRKSARAHLS